MGVKFNPLIFSGLDIAGSSGVTTWKEPVADEASLPATGSDGEARVVLATDHIYLWDSTTSQWIDTGIVIGSFGSTPNSSGLTINLNDKGNNVTETQLILQPADSSNPGAVSTLAQNFAGNKTFDNDVIVTGDFTVNGTSTTINTATLDVEDANITINKNGNDISAEGSGLTVERVGTDGSLVYQDSLSSKFKIGSLGSESEVITASTTQTMSGNKTFSGIVNLSTLTASRPLKLDGSNNVTSGLIDLTTDVTGILPISNGGTNNSTTPTDGQLLIGNGTDFTLATITGTSNQVNVSNASGSITISTPQDIAVLSSPEFAGLTLTAFSGTVKAVAGVLSASAIVNADIDASAAIDATKIHDGSVDNTEFSYLNGVTSSIQTQLDNKQPLDSTLTALATFNSNGLLTQTAPDTFVSRTITAGSTQVSVVDGDGISGNPTIDVNVGNIDHDSLLNFVSNEHIDHISVLINTISDSGLTGGGDISASRSLSVDILGTTLAASSESTDLVLVYDASATALRRMTRNTLLGSSAPSIGDVSETEVSFLQSQTDTVILTLDSQVRSAEIVLSLIVDADTDLFERFEIEAATDGSTWNHSIVSVGNSDLDIEFDNVTGQLKYTSGTYSGFNGINSKFKYRITSTTK